MTIYIDLVKLLAMMNEIQVSKEYDIECDEEGERIFFRPYFERYVETFFSFTIEDTIATVDQFI